MTVRTLIRRMLPVEWQAPTHLPQRLLAQTGYFRLRTWLAAHGDHIPDAHLYQPLFAPWEGEKEFDSLYREIKPYTLVSRDRCYVLWRTLQQAIRVQGDFMECGVFRGGTALLAAKTLNGKMQNRKMHIFDSFKGMPKTTDGIDRFESGDFSSTSEEAVKQLMKPFPFVDIHAGFIPQTFSGLSIRQVAWAHVDVDIYQSVRDCIAYIYPRLAPGGYIIFDDYGFPSCASARRAVDEIFAQLPEVPLYLPTAQCIVIKLG